MPADVTSTLEEIISEESGISKESAARWLRQLEKAGRFYTEAWSWSRLDFWDWFWEKDMEEVRL